MIRRFALASAVLIAAASATPAMAGTATSNLDVSANVPVSCNISTSPLAFGAYDPIGTNASNNHKLMSGNVTTTCTKDAAVKITLGQGSNPSASSSDTIPERRLKDGNNNYLSYQIFKESQLASIWGNTEEVSLAVTGTGSAVSNTIYGRILGGQNAPAGNYTDTIVATVTY